MSYVLVYAIDGHEHSCQRSSLDEVNRRIRSMYDYGPDSFTVLRIEEGHDGPRTWQIEYPPAPPAGTRVRDRNGVIWTTGEYGSIESDDHSYSWNGALEDLGPLTEVVETEVEAAARRLREAGYTKVDAIDYAHAEDIAAVLAHVLNGGQL